MSKRVCVCGGGGTGVVCPGGSGGPCLTGRVSEHVLRMSTARGIRRLTVSLSNSWPIVWGQEVCEGVLGVTHCSGSHSHAPGLALDGTHWKGGGSRPAGPAPNRRAQKECPPPFHGAGHGPVPQRSLWLQTEDTQQSTRQYTSM